MVARATRPARISEQRQALLATQHQRLMVLMLLFAAAIVLVIGRLAMLAFDGGPSRVAAISTAPRGDIVDRNGQQLARTHHTAAVG